MTTIKMKASGKNQRLINDGMISNTLEFTAVANGETNNMLTTQIFVNNINLELASQFEVGKVYNISFEDEV